MLSSGIELPSEADGTVSGRSSLTKHALVRRYFANSMVLSELADTWHCPGVCRSGVFVQEVVPAGKL